MVFKSIFDNQVVFDRRNPFQYKSKEGIQAGVQKVPDLILMLVCRELFWVVSLERKKTETSLKAGSQTPKTQSPIATWGSKFILVFKIICTVLKKLLY